MRLRWFLFVLAASLLMGNLAKADSITSLSVSVSDGGTDDWTISASLNDWFFSADSLPPFPAELNPSDQWTSAANITTLNYWLSLVLEFGETDDSSDLVSLYGAGTISSPDPAAPVIQITQVNQFSPTNTQSLVGQTSSQDLVSAPESAPELGTLWLFAGGWALIGLSRTRFAIIDHGPLRRIDHSRCH